MSLTSYFSVPQQISRDRLLFTIPWLSTEWILSFDFIMTKTTWTDCDWANLLHLTITGNRDDYGGRIPAIYIECSTRKLFVFSSISGNGNFIHEIKQINPNVLYHIEIHQRYTSGGNYRFFVRIDGVETIPVINTDARQFYNVKVYASDPFYIPVDCVISNLHHTNFL